MAADQTLAAVTIPSSLADTADSKHYVFEVMGFPFVSIDSSIGGGGGGGSTRPSAGFLYPRGDG